MWWIQFACAGSIQFVSEIPSQIAVDGRLVAQVYSSASVVIEHTAGPAKLAIATHGEPKFYDIIIPETGFSHIVIGRTGVTVGASPALVAQENGEIEFRASGNQTILLEWMGERLRLEPGAVRKFKLLEGNYPLIAKNANGTILFARGQLNIAPNALAVVQIASGRLPEISGTGAVFQPESP